MPLLEVTASELTPSLLKHGLIENGAILVRGFADTLALASIRAVLENELNALEKLPKDAFEEGMKSSDPMIANYWRQLAGGKMNEYDFRKVQGNVLSFYEAVPSALQLLQKAMPDFRFAESPGWVSCRRVLPKSTAAETQTWDKPIYWHVDAQYHKDQVMQVNFWTPLHACGYFAPGLEVIAVGIDRTMKYLGYNDDGYPQEPGDIQQTHKFLRERFTDEYISENFSDDEIAKPTFAAGDVLIQSNYTLHKTSYYESTVRPRISLEVRFDAEKRPF